MAAKGGVKTERKRWTGNAGCPPGVPTVAGVGERDGSAAVVPTAEGSVATQAPSRRRWRKC
jgi:hypothetical protein